MMLDKKWRGSVGTMSLVMSDNDRGDENTTTVITTVIMTVTTAIDVGEALEGTL